VRKARESRRPGLNGLAGRFRARGKISSRLPEGVRRGHDQIPFTAGSSARRGARSAGHFGHAGPLERFFAANALSAGRIRPPSQQKESRTQVGRRSSLTTNAAACVVHAQARGLFALLATELHAQESGVRSRSVLPARFR